MIGGANRMKTKLGTWGVVITIAAIASTASVAGTLYYLQAFSRQKLVAATTTSLYDTLLLDEIEERFEEKYPIDLRLISVGTGIAIQFAQRGDVDMLLVAIWFSRGDNSGTHTKEKALWAAAGFNWTLLRDETNWFRETGSGMGKALIVANELEAYTLTDIGTFLAYSQDTSNLVPNLKALVSQEAELINVYSAIAANKTTNSNANFEAATTFTKFLLSKEGQQIIENYGIPTYGQPLFYPAVELLKNDTEPIAQMIKEYGYLDGSECPPQYRSDHLELYS